MEPFRTLTGTRRAARPRERRHRRDHPQAVPEVDQAHRLRPEPLRRMALPRSRRAGRRHFAARGQSAVRAERAALQGRADPARAAQLRLRQLARARAVGAVRLRLSRADRAVVSPTSSSRTAFKNGLLPIVLSAHEVDRLFHETAALPGFRLTVDLETADGRDDRRRGGVRLRDRSVPQALPANGLDEIGLTLNQADLIRAFEAKHLAQYPWLA